MILKNAITEGDTLPAFMTKVQMPISPINLYDLEESKNGIEELIRYSHQSNIKRLFAIKTDLEIIALIRINSFGL